MALEADAVDGGAGVLDDSDDFESAFCLGAVVLKVVVVVVPDTYISSTLDHLPSLVYRGKPLNVKDGLTAWYRGQQPSQR